MKKCFIFFFFIFFVHASFAQFVIRGYYYQPLERFGFYLKPAYSVEMGYILAFKEKRFRLCFSATYLKMHPRLEEFHGFNLFSDKDPIEIYTLSFKKFDLFQTFAGGDFAFIKRKIFQCDIGADFILGGTIRNYLEKNDYSAGLTSINSNDPVTGVRGRVGAQFQLTKHISLFFNAQISACEILDGFKLFRNDFDFNRFKATDFGIGLHYLFIKKEK